MKKLSEEQLNNIKSVGIVMLATSSKNCMPHCTIVEPSRCFHDKIIIPIVQMEISKKNILENPNVFIHVFKNDSELCIQYKLNCIATIETKGDLFNEIKHYEETEVLPSGMFVKGILICDIIDCTEFVE